MPASFACRLALPTVAAALLAASAPAQRLAFDAKSYAVAPGEAVTLKILVSDCGDPVAGVRYTVRTKAGDPGELLLDKSTSFPGESFRAFACAQNVLPAREAAEGFLKGNVAELRGALYAFDTATPRVLAREEKHAVTVVLPVGLQASGRFIVELAADADENGDPLSGIFDTRGRPMAPPDRAAPLTSIASIIVHDGRSDMVSDFAKGDADGWVFESAPAPDGEAVAAGIATGDGGLTIVGESAQAMGTWRFDVDRLGAWRLQPARAMYLARATAAGTDGSWISLRAAATETVARAQGMDAAEESAILLEAPESQQEIDLRFSLLPGSDEGRRTGVLSALDERMVSVDLLGKKRTDYLRVFSAGQDGKWKPAESSEFGSFDVRHPNDVSGLGVAIGGEAGSFAVGSWTTPAGVSGMMADPGRWYRAEADLIVPEGSQPPSAARLRVHTRDHRWTAMGTARPAGAGSAKAVFWFVPPASADATELFATFDVLGTASEAGASGDTRAYLKQLRVESWAAPTEPPAAVASN